MHLRSASAYKNAYVAAAPTHRILDDLFARLLRDLHEGEAALRAGQTRPRIDALAHAVRVVEGLTSVLDVERAPEVASRIGALYDFVADRILRANTARSADEAVTALREAASIVETLRSSLPG